jgi:hypothetical protein
MSDEQFTKDRQHNFVDRSNSVAREICEHLELPYTKQRWDPKFMWLAAKLQSLMFSIDEESRNAASAAPQATGGLRELVAKLRKEAEESKRIFQENQEKMARGEYITVTCTQGSWSPPEERFALELEAVLAQSQVPSLERCAELIDKALDNLGEQIPAEVTEHQQGMMRMFGHCSMTIHNLIAELLREAQPPQADPAPAGLGEALNSGDGSYRP